MKVILQMCAEQEIYVQSWAAKTPGAVITLLCQQLEAAQAVWPELKEYAVVKRRSRRRPAASP